MQATVLVSFSGDRQYEFRLAASGGKPMSADDAQQWLSGEWTEFGCVPSNPVGKVLLIDKILLVAQYAGEKRFAEAGDWAQHYARAVVAILGRNTVHVDVAQHVVG